MISEFLRFITDDDPLPKKSELPTADEVCPHCGRVSETLPVLRDTTPMPRNGYEPAILPDWVRSQGF